MVWGLGRGTFVFGSWRWNGWVVKRTDVEGERWRGWRRGDRWEAGFCWWVWVEFEVGLGGRRCWCLFRRLWRAVWWGAALVLAA